MFRRIFLFAVYWLAPLASLVLIIAGGRFSFFGWVMFAALFFFFLIRGRDWKGNPTIMGIREDSTFFGKQTRVDRTDQRE
ncbi:hypothetical protein [Altererythrobacter sp. GH1-8]|uniref:hypothetical protein n=1 Tax=Altererythrobacter sp. GH1-8 TaxID=3349333 RepID=UPI00374CBA01